MKNVYWEVSGNDNGAAHDPIRSRETAPFAEK